MYSRKILCHADLPKRWKLEKHTPYWDINVQSINRLKNMVRHIPGKLVFAPILKNWRVIYYILLFMRSFPALWTQSAGIVQYRHLVISGFSTKCRYCSIPALCHFRFEQNKDYFVKQTKEKVISVTTYFSLVQSFT